MQTFDQLSIMMVANDNANMLIKIQIYKYDTCIQDGHVEYGSFVFSSGSVF